MGNCIQVLAILAHTKHKEIALAVFEGDFLAKTGAFYHVLAFCFTDGFEHCFFVVLIAVDLLGLLHCFEYLVFAFQKCEVRPLREFKFPPMRFDAKRARCFIHIY